MFRLRSAFPPGGIGSILPLTLQAVASLSNPRRFFVLFSTLVGIPRRICFSEGRLCHGKTNESRVSRSCSSRHLTRQRMTGHLSMRRRPPQVSRAPRQGRSLLRVAAHWLGPHVESL